MHRSQHLFRYLLGLVLLAAILMSVAIVREDQYGSGGRRSDTPVEGPKREVAFVSNVVDGSVSLIDLETFTVVKTLDIIPDGRRVSPARGVLQWAAQGFLEDRGGLNYAQDTDVSRDGTVLFVSRGFLGDVAAFDIATGDLLWRQAIAGFRADHMTLSPDGRRLYVSALIYGGNKVQELASESGKVLGSFRAGQWPHDVHTDASGRRIYVASLGNMLKDLPARDTDPDAYRVTVADADSLSVLRHFSFPAGVRPFAVTDNQKRLYAQLSNTHALVAWDLENDRQLARLDLPVKEGVIEADWDFEAPHHGLALTADESSLCIAGRASDYAAIVDLDTLSLRTIIDVGDAPSWATLNRRGTLCILPNTRSDDVSVISMSDAVEVARIATGRAPKHVTVATVGVCTLSSNC